MKRLPLLLLLFFYSAYGKAQFLHSGIYVSRQDTIVFNEMKDDYLSYFNTQSGRIGSLKKMDDARFLLGRFNKKPDSLKADVACIIQFLPGGKTVVFQRPDGKRTTYHKGNYVEKYVSIPVSDSVVLGAKLVIPAAPHPLPLLVVAHGSESVSNDFYKESYLFASWGIATLVIDKQGFGNSTGKPNPDIFTQADDLAAVALYGSRLPEIDPQKIGLWGFSQGGWVSPLAIIHQPLFHYALILSGPATTAFEEELAGIRKSLAFYGFKKPDIQNATDLLSEIYLTLQHEKNWQYLDSLKSRFQNRPWYPVMIKQSLICSYFLGENASYIKDHFTELVSRDPYRNWCFYDPARYINRIKVPVLWIYGSEDKSIPVEASRDILNRSRLDFGNTFTVGWLQGVNHAGYIDGHAGVEDYDRVQYVSPEYLHMMKRWLKKNGILK